MLSSDYQLGANKSPAKNQHQAANQSARPHTQDIQEAEEEFNPRHEEDEDSEHLLIPAQSSSCPTRPTGPREVSILAGPSKAAEAAPECEQYTYTLYFKALTFTFHIILNNRYTTISRPPTITLPLIFPLHLNPLRLNHLQIKPPCSSLEGIRGFNSRILMMMKRLQPPLNSRRSVLQSRLR